MNKPRWRWDWKANSAWRRADGRLQVWMPGGWIVNTYLKVSHETI